MEEALRDLLLGTSAITLICGTRIDWTSSTQGAAPPRLVLSRIGGAEGNTLSGSDGLLVASVQVDAYAVTRKDAGALARAVTARLHGYRGGGFRGVFHLATRDTREGGSGEADRLFRVSMDFSVSWRQT